MRIRTRLLIVSLVTLAVGLGVLLVVGNLLFAATISGQTQRLLVTRADAQIAALTVRPAGVSIRPTHNDGTLDDRAWIFNRRRVLERPTRVPAAVDRLAGLLGSQPGTSRTATVDEYLIKSVPLFAGTPAHQVGAVVVGINGAAFDSLRHKVLLGSLAMAAVLLFVVGLAVDHALRGALGPVGTMTEAAADWSEHDLERRFAVGPPRDEIGGLAATLDRLLDRIAASRRHERRFAADVAHELRSPLAAIRGRVDLSLDPRGSDDDHAAALRSVGAQAARMAATVDALLAVARAETDPEEGRVDLAAIARDFEGVEVRTQPGLAPAEGEPELVRRALAPLVENARWYARTQIVIELTTSDGRSRATVRDDGPGLDPALGDAVFKPGCRGADALWGGAGLGLPLARRLARACGGEVSATAGPGGCFTLELPVAGGNRRPTAAEPQASRGLA
jgi:signal transduction histidine kinase